MGVLKRGERGDDYETDLKKRGLIEMSTTVLPLRDARSLRFEYLRGLLDVFKFRVVSEAFIKCWQHWCNKHFRTFSTIKELDPNCKLNLELFSNIKKKRQIKTEKKRRKLVYTDWDLCLNENKTK